MDILGLSFKEIDALGLKEYLAAVNYSVATYLIKNQIINKDKIDDINMKNNETMYFNQGDDWNLDKEAFDSIFEPGGVAK